MKKLNVNIILITIIMFLGLVLNSKPFVIKAAVIGDDYPIHWKRGYGADTWGMYKRQCTSFVAHRLHSTNGFSLPRGYGNAISWGDTARKQGYRVDMNPSVGSVAWFGNGINGAGYYGHVAWVSEVNADMVTIEEYNYDYGQGPEKYYKRSFHKNLVSGYIHFKDINDSSNLVPTVSEPASKGIFYFKTKAGVQTTPDINSSTLAYYNAGQSVYYDKLFEKNGYQWVSYISSSNVRRYIAVKRLSTSEPIETASSNTSNDSKVVVGDTVIFSGTFRVTAVISRDLITSSELAGGQPTSLNYIDPSPVLETNKNGQKFGDQVLHPGEYFTIPGQFKVKKIDIASNGAYLTIGNRDTWVSLSKLIKQ